MNLQALQKKITLNRYGIFQVSFSLSAKMITLRLFYDLRCKTRMDNLKMSWRIIYQIWHLTYILSQSTIGLNIPESSRNSAWPPQTISRFNFMFFWVRILYRKSHNFFVSQISLGLTSKLLQGNCLGISFQTKGIYNLIVVIRWRQWILYAFSHKPIEIHLYFSFFEWKW